MKAIVLSSASFKEEKILKRDLGEEQRGGLAKSVSSSAQWIIGSWITVLMSEKADKR